MEPNEDDQPTTVFPAATSFPPELTTPIPASQRRVGHRGRVAVTAGVAVALVAVGTGLGLVLAPSHDDRAQTSAASTSAPSTEADALAPSDGQGPDAKPGKAKREAWAHQYGQERSTMPAQPDVASATAEQRAAATDLLTRTEAATAQFDDLNVARAGGFDVQGTIAKAEQRNQKLAQRISEADASGTTAKPMLLPVPNRANLRDGKVLDPTAPDALLYAYEGHNVWKLVGATFVAKGSYPQAPPDPGGPITRWSYGAHGGVLTMRIFFSPGNDLAQAYATTLQSS